MRSDLPSWGSATRSSGPSEGAIELEALRARRRPGTILFVYAIHAVLAIAIAAPVSSVLAGTLVNLPEGDAVLFEPGGLYLAEAIRTTLGPIVATIKGELWLLLWASYLGLLPLGALIHALNRRGRVRAAELAFAAMAALGPYSILFGLALASMAFSTTFFALAAWAGSIDLDRLSWRLGAFAGAWMLAIAAIGIVHDLARAAVIRHAVGVREAVARASNVLLRHPLRAALGWLWRIALALALVGAGAALCHRVGIDGSRRFATVAVVHQVIAAALVALRASWLACALRLVAWPSATGNEALSDAAADIVKPSDALIDDPSDH